MSKSKFMAKNELTAKVQPSMQRQTESWANECDDILTMLEHSTVPRTRKDIQFEQMLSDSQTLKRLDDLINAGDVRKREDGPDGRLVYYEPATTWHVSWGGQWGADIGILGTVVVE